MLAPVETRPWLNTRRLRAQGIVLALCLWGTCAWIMTAPGVLGRNGLLKGTDFLHFYTLGSLALEHRGAALYDVAAQSELAARRVPEAGHIFFVSLYGPQVSLLFAPFAALPYGAALAAWLILNAVLYGLCCYAVWRTCPHLQSNGSLILILALAYPAFFHLIVWGQSAGLALACFTGAYLALRADRKFLAGLAIGCLMIKPQLGLAAGVVLVAAGEWMLISSALASAAANLLMGWSYYGTPAMRNYFAQLWHVSDVMPQLEPRLYQMHSLRAFWAMLLPWPQVSFWLYVASAIGVLYLTFLCWKSQASLSLRFSALLLATVLVSPHLTVYDLVILAPTFLLMADWAEGKWSALTWLGPLLYLTYLLPLAGPLARWTHVQLSTLAMCGLLWVVDRSSLSESPNRRTPA
jgi:alpha-1,2-mannosyltransferase